MDLWQFLERHVEQTPEKVLLRYRDTQQSYAGFLQTALRAAGALQALGVRKDDTVCLMLRNSPDYLCVWFGLARLGERSGRGSTSARGAGPYTRCAQSALACVQSGRRDE